MDIIKEWTSMPMPKLLTGASCRKDWKRISAESSLMSPQTTQSVKGLNWTELNMCSQMRHITLILMLDLNQHSGLPLADQIAGLLECNYRRWC